MKNYARKRLPYEIYDPAGLEEWFGQMAEQGWYLSGYVFGLAEFLRGEPRTGVRYRLEAKSQDEEDREKNRAYAQAGWQYVTDMFRYYWVYRADDPALPDLHTDPVIQSYTMKHLLWFLGAYGWVLAIRLFQFGFYLTVDPGIYLEYPGMILMELGVLCIAAVYAHSYWKFRGMRKRMRNGLYSRTGPRCPRVFWRHEFVWLVIVLMVAGCLRPTLWF